MLCPCKNVKELLEKSTEKNNIGIGSIQRLEIWKWYEVAFRAAERN